MKTTLREIDSTNTKTNYIESLRQMGETFAKRAVDYDKSAKFVSDNYEDLRTHGFFAAAIPIELGGGGADFEEMTDIVREIARHCASTALSFAMHTHPVAVNVYKHLHGDAVATKTLEKIAVNDLIIAGTGANDWLDSSGEAERVEGGYRVTAHKRFVSGAPGAQVFITSVRYNSSDGVEVLHFATPFGGEGLQLVETWDALGMRGTGSHDVIMNQVFVPDSAIVARRPAGVWHPMWNVILPTALPLITSAYVGLAEAATELAKTSARFRQAELAPVVGEMMNTLTVAQMTLADMVRLNNNHRFKPNLTLADAMLRRKTIAADAIKQTVEFAAELVGGPGFLHGHAMERIVRDVRAMHYHPLPARRQRIISGRIALGFEPVELAI